MASVIGLDKFARLIQIIRHNGGIFKSLRALYLDAEVRVMLLLILKFLFGRREELKIGTLVGEDKYGNRYYENNEYFFGRNRWIEYADHVKLEYDASQVPVEWYGWLHYKTDLPPHKDPNRPKYKWMLQEHEPNLSGTNKIYVPYSTTRPKIEAWKP